MLLMVVENQMPGGVSSASAIPLKDSSSWVVLELDCGMCMKSRCAFSVYINFKGDRRSVNFGLCV